MPKLIMLKGLPASGKSTWCKEYLKTHSNTVRINNDELRKMFFAGSFDLKKHEQWVTATRNNLINYYMSVGMDIIVDNLNLHPKHEEYLRQVVEKHNSVDFISEEKRYSFESVFFDVPLLECLKRNSLRPESDRVPDKVIRSWYRNFLRKEIKLEQNPELPKTILCDLDGTLALFGDRNPYDRDFENDEVNFPVRDLLLRFMPIEDYNTHKILFLSGRQEKYRDQTVQFLHFKCGFVGLDYQLFMRKDGDKRPDEIVKREIFDTKIKDKYFVEFIIDDRPKVCRMWRELGLFVFQVGDPYDEF